MFCIPFTFLSCSVPPSPFTTLSSPTFPFCHVLSFLHPPVFCLHRVPILFCILFSLQYYMTFILASFASTVSPFPSPLICPLPLHFSFTILLTGSPSNSISTCNSTPYPDYFFLSMTCFFTLVQLFIFSPLHPNITTHLIPFRSYFPLLLLSPALKEYLGERRRQRPRLNSPSM